MVKAIITKSKAFCLDKLLYKNIHTNIYINIEYDLDYYFSLSISENKLIREDGTNRVLGMNDR